MLKVKTIHIREIETMDFGLFIPKKKKKTGTPFNISLIIFNVFLFLLNLMSTLNIFSCDVNC